MMRLCRQALNHAKPAQPVCDVTIIGGGAVGCSIAYFLASSNNKLAVKVIERDPSYLRCSSVLAAGGIRHQFSNVENIDIGVFGSSFFRNIDEHLRLQKSPDEKVDIGFREEGYLLLAKDESQWETLKRNREVQLQHGAENLLLESWALQEKFPWLNTTDLVGGCYGVRGEGFFDPYSYLTALRRKATELGVQFVQGEVTKINRLPQGSVQSIILSDGSEVHAHTTVCAAGALSGRVSQMVGLNLPVRPRKRCIFVVTCPFELPHCPLVVDPRGAYFRPEGKQQFIMGKSPSEDPDAYDDFEVDPRIFEEEIWPELAQRVPLFETLRQTRAWAGHYDHNITDHNAIVGVHDSVPNCIFACGFSGIHYHRKVGGYEN
eukprot:TRINITY_DN7380_c0_g1_i2.p1 TRINITY_DN7380_c0_g1~~TRINITY_DN7380_c0_g1_i2.p1  ORF type:complete len:385 (+),score=56.75 TRINITY_DN7380_c0_g1_i2:29-1156(+)